MRPLSLPPPDVRRGTGLPLSDAVAAHVRGLIAAGRLRPATRVPGARELAAQWPVGYVAIQNALQQCAAEGLLVRRPGRGTVVAASRASHPQAGSIHLVIHQTEAESFHRDYAASEYFLSLAGGLQDELTARRVMVSTLTVGSAIQERLVLGRIGAETADAVVCARLKSRDFAAKLERLGIPALFVEPHIAPGRRRHLLLHDERRRAADFVDYFVARGCTRIALLHRGSGKWTDTLQLSALRAAFEERGIAWNAAWLRTLAPGAGRQPLTRALGDILRARPAPNALIVNHVGPGEFAAAWAASGGRDRGAAPLLGAYHSERGDYAHAAITANVDGRAFGRCIARALLHYVYEASGPFPAKLLVPFEMVTNATCAGKS